jgi:hypothetical protein
MQQVVEQVIADLKTQRAEKNYVLCCMPYLPAN